MTSQDSIKVAVRVRPLLKHELDAGSKSCLTVLQAVSQVQVRGLNVDEAFTYNHVFSTTHTQQDLYKSAVKPLIPNLFSGYNVTVLAYGQTGSGKTHSMGTSCGTDDGSNDGVIPKSIHEIYEVIKKSCDSEFTVNVSFLEVNIISNLYSDSYSGRS